MIPAGLVGLVAGPRRRAPYPLCPHPACVYAQLHDGARSCPQRPVTQLVAPHGHSVRHGIVMRCQACEQVAIKAAGEFSTPRGAVSSENRWPFGLFLSHSAPATGNRRYRTGRFPQWETCRSAILQKMGAKQAREGGRTTVTFPIRDTNPDCRWAGYAARTRRKRRPSGQCRSVKG
jgi:hypothetical protein